MMDDSSALQRSGLLWVAGMSKWKRGFCFRSRDGSTCAVLTLLRVGRLTDGAAEIVWVLLVFGAAAIQALGLRIGLRGIRADKLNVICLC